MISKALKIAYHYISSLLFKKLGLTYNNTNHNIFITRQGLIRPIMSMFINKFKIMRSKNMGVVVRVKIKLSIDFDMVNMRLISFYLDSKMVIKCQKRIIKLLELAYI